MSERLRRLIFGDTRIRPVLPDEVTPSKLPPHLEKAAKQGDQLGLKLMQTLVETAQISSRIRQTLAEEVAIKVQRRGL
jgi:hypothetical protein